MGHEEHEDVAIGIARGECNPNFAIGRHRSYDVDLLAESLVWCSIPQASMLPSLLMEISMRDPALVYVNDSFSFLVNLEHLLRI